MGVAWCTGAGVGSAKLFGDKVKSDSYLGKQYLLT